MPRDRLKVVIVGAGIGGLSAHLACARAGFDVEHYERQSHLGAAGAGIIVWPDGVKVLESLGLGERLAIIGNRPDVLELRDPDDRMLSELPLREIWDRTGAPGYVVSRTDLQSILLEAVGAWRVRTGARCVGLDQDEAGVVVHLEGGQEAKGDIAVGADGIHSAVRNTVAPGGEPSYAGIASWVGIVPNDGLQPVSVVTEYVGEGKRCGLLPLSNNRVYFNFTAAWDRSQPRPASGWTEVVERLFAGWPPQIQAVLGALRAASRSTWRSPTYPTSADGAPGGRPCWVMPPMRRRPRSARARARRSRMWSSSSGAWSVGDRRGRRLAPLRVGAQAAGRAPRRPVAQGGREAPREGRIDVWRVVPGDPSLVRASDHPDHRGLARARSRGMNGGR